MRLSISGHTEPKLAAKEDPNEGNIDALVISHIQDSGALSLKFNKDVTLFIKYIYQID